MRARLRFYKVVLFIRNNYNSCLRFLLECRNIWYLLCFSKVHWFWAPYYRFTLNGDIWWKVVNNPNSLSHLALDFSLTSLRWLICFSYNLDWIRVCVCEKLSVILWAGGITEIVEIYKLVVCALPYIIILIQIFMNVVFWSIRVLLTEISKHETHIWVYHYLSNSLLLVLLIQLLWLLLGHHFQRRVINV